MLNHFERIMGDIMTLYVNVMKYKSWKEGKDIDRQKFDDVLHQFEGFTCGITHDSRSDNKC